MHGHITSLSVLRSHRKLGIASRLMEAARRPSLNAPPKAYRHASSRVSLLSEAMPETIVAAMLNLKSLFTRLHDLDL